MAYILAVDVGGTKVAAGVMSDHNRWVSYVKVESDTASPTRMYDSVLFGIQQAIQEANLTEEQISHIGITLPGQLDLEQGIAIYQNNLPWRNFRIGDKLRERFPEKSFTFEHDVVAAALGEWSIRDLQEELLIYVTVSTGLSASIIYKGKPMRGAGYAGEIGFFPVKDKTLETYASGSAMQKELIKNYGGISIEEAMDLWKNGDENLANFFHKRAYEIALSLFNLTAALDPHKIVMGGGVINNQEPFFELIKENFRSLCHHPVQKSWAEKIERSTLKSKSGLYGIAMKARDSV